MTRRGWVAIGAVIAAVAFAGWLATMLALSFAANPDTTEDLTTEWIESGATPLGSPDTVTVPAGQTLVAFLVGTQLRGIAGTTTGTCTASAAGRPLTLGRPVHVNRSLTEILTDGQETVAVAGWTNHSAAPVEVRITCDSRDSTVDHFVAVPSRTAVLESRPWFQPWGWAGLGALGVALALAGLLRRS